MWDHWKLSHWTAFYDWKLQRFWLISLQLFLQCSSKRAEFQTCLLKDLTKKIHCVVLSALLSEVILKQLLVCPEVFLTESHKRKRSIFVALGFVTFISLFFLECLTIWNTKFQTLQASKELPLGTSGQVSSVFTLWFINLHLLHMAQ